MQETGAPRPVEQAGNSPGGRLGKQCEGALNRQDDVARVHFRCNLERRNADGAEQSERLERASEGRLYPGLTSIMYLTACHFPTHIDRVYANTPALRPRGYERLFTDDRYRDVWEVGLPAEQP